MDVLELLESYIEASDDIKNQIDEILKESQPPHELRETQFEKRQESLMLL